MGLFPGDDAITVICLESTGDLSPSIDTWCGPGDEIRNVTDVASGLDELDQSVDAVVVEGNFAQEKAVWRLRAKPYFGPLMMVIDDEGVDGDELPVDLYLKRPIDDQTIQQALERLIISARIYEYERELLVRLSEKRQLEDDMTDAELETNPDYQLLLEEIETRMQRIDVNVTTVSSKYRPPMCGNCGLRWDISVGSTLGFVRMSSYSWKCVECGEIAPNVNPFDRSVARR